MATVEHVLERRYRRLLACYPAAYRAANAEEMLGVALARSAEGQRWPGLGETASLVTSGIGKRLGFRALRTGLGDEAWQDASAVLTIIGPVLLATAAMRDGVLSHSAFGLSLVPVRLIHAGCWALLAIAGVLRWRQIAAAGAVAGLAGEIAWLVQDAPYGLVRDWWQLILAALTAIAALVAVRGTRPVLAWRTGLALSAGAAIPAAWAAVQGATGSGVPPDRAFGIRNSLWSSAELTDLAAVSVTGLILAIVLARLRPAIRRRVAVFLVPVVAAYLLVAVTSGDFLDPALRFVAGRPLYPAQLVALPLVPVACFLAGLVWLARYERMLNRIAQEGPVS